MDTPAAPWSLARDLVSWQSLTFKLHLNLWKHFLSIKEKKDGKKTQNVKEHISFNINSNCRTMYQMKANVMPHLYWFGLVKGWWEGPKPFRKLFHFGLSK